MGKTTIQINTTTRERLAEFKPSPSTTWDWVITWILDKLEESDETINELHSEVKQLKKEKEAS